MREKSMAWPEGADFAFSIFDDTDHAMLNNVMDVYSLLADNGFKTTKSVWVLNNDAYSKIMGETCDDRKYLNWILRLKSAGFEIGYHMTSYTSSVREKIIEGLERFKDNFGHYPLTMANHYYNKENMYWGEYRLSGLKRHVYRILTQNRNNGAFRGHLENDRYFWGDICLDKIKYVRNFVFPDINTLKQCRYMPYHDAKRPYVKYWFSSSEGANADSFARCISEKNQDRLEEQRGACIMYTHFGKGFYENGRLEPRFKFLIERLGKKKGWFVPVNVLLDYLLDKNGGHIIKDSERNRLESKWFFSRISKGIS